MSHRAYSPAEITRRQYRTIPWEDPWLRAFGAPELTATWFISGASASGKSSFVMQLARQLTNYGRVLYLSYEEGVSLAFQQRLILFHLDQCQGRFRVATDDTPDDLRHRLATRNSPHFIIIDSFQHAGWDFPTALALIRDFPRKSFIFISQEAKSQPLGKPAVRLRYAADVKVRVVNFRAYCQGRFTQDPAAAYTVWEEGILRTTNNLPL